MVTQLRCQTKHTVHKTDYSRDVRVNTSLILGMFEPMSTNKSETKNTFTAGLTFPELTLQVYQVT
jgi:hypothetical protein